MQAVSAEQIQELFPREKDLPLPDLASVDWGVLDYLGWIHPGGYRGYVVYQGFGEPIGLKLNRIPARNIRQRAGMCSWCHHMHRGGGTAMFTASVSGSDGRRSVGNLMCSQLDCSLRIRNLCSDPPSTMPETIALQSKIARLEYALGKFILRVAAPA